NLEGAFQVERIGRTVVDDPALGMAQRAHRGMAHRLGHLARELVTRLPLSRVETELHPVELPEDVVGKVQLPVAANVHLAPPADTRADRAARRALPRPAHRAARRAPRRTPGFRWRARAPSRAVSDRRRRARPALPRR